MESTGWSYVFEPPEGEPRPMPVLERLAAEGWLLAAHRSTANTSPRALFSIFSGLYPTFTSEIRETRPDCVLPGLPGYLPDHADRFLYTPGRMQSFFPLSFLRSSGMTELWGYENIDATGFSRGKANGLNEHDVARAFIARLEGAREPFLAVYTSYVPHYQYRDYGPDNRIFADTASPFARYRNNLRLLDEVVGDILGALAAAGRLERTAVLLAGDHGEAFGQRPGNVTHARRSYEENLRVPAIFWQPAIFAPRRIEEPTSPVDLLPTLLEGLGVPYDPAEMQGESLWRPVTRGFVFAVGNEETITYWDRDGIKVQASLTADRCWAYDLAWDPGERKRLRCEDHAEQARALLSFREWHDGAQRERNALLLEARR